MTHVPMPYFDQGDQFLYRPKQGRKGWYAYIVQWPEDPSRLNPITKEPMTWRTSGAKNLDLEKVIEGWYDHRVLYVAHNELIIPESHLCVRGSECDIEHLGLRKEGDIPVFSEHKSAYPKYAHVYAAIGLQSLEESK